MGAGAKRKQVAPRLLRGHGQVGLADALRISFGSAVSSRAAHISTVVWGLAFGLLSAQWAPPRERPWVMLVAFCIAAAISYGSMFPWRLRLLSRHRPLALRILANGLLAFAVGFLVFYILILGVNVVLEGSRALRLPKLQSTLVFALYGFQFPLVGFYITLSADVAHREQVQLKETERFERMAEKARLVALRSQINPHFFFNALNTIAALIPIRPLDAERAVELLATALRPVLMREQPMVATLESELVVAQAYTAIEELRLGGRCRFIYDARAGTEQCLMPSLSLQPVLENAVRHGAMRVNGNYEIRLRTWRDEDASLHIQVINQVIHKSRGISGYSENGETVPLVKGHALHNINERLQMLFGADAGLIVERLHDEQGAICEMVVPQPDGLNPAGESTVTLEKTAV